MLSAVSSKKEYVIVEVPVALKIPEMDQEKAAHNTLTISFALPIRQTHVLLPGGWRDFPALFVLDYFFMYCAWKMLRRRRQAMVALVAEGKLIGLGRAVALPIPVPLYRIIGVWG